MFLSLSVSLSGLFICVYFVNWLYILCHILIIKFKTLVKGCIEIPGGECYRLKIWVMEMMIWFFHSSREYNWWKYWQVCRWMGMAFLCMHNAFPTEMGEQMTLTSFSDVIVAWLVHWGKAIKEKHARALGLSSGFLELNVSVN